MTCGRSGGSAAGALEREPCDDDLGTILGVWAHPDDEGYLSGGIMAAAARDGRRVVCVTATRGEAADPERWPPADLAKIREAEIAACMEILGVADHRFFDYPDGGCAAADADEAADRIATIVDEVRPDTVLTFGPDGMTGHPDHIAVSDWTARAVARAGTGAALYFATKTPTWIAAFAASADEMGVMMDDDVEFPCTPVDQLAIYEVFDGALLDRKERAMCAQATQVLDLREAMGADVYRDLLREEVFRRP